MRKETKTFNFKMSKDSWLFLKRRAVEKEMSMTEIVNTCLEQHIKRVEAQRKTPE